MSDLLAPVLCELRDEVATFWCFVGLMQRAVFVATPTDRDMDRSLRYLRELIKLMVPKFYEHLEKHKDAMELLFCHRWILLYELSIIFIVWCTTFLLQMFQEGVYGRRCSENVGSLLGQLLDRLLSLVSLSGYSIGVRRWRNCSKLTVRWDAVTFQFTW